MIYIRLCHSTDHLILPRAVFVKLLIETAVDFSPNLFIINFLLGIKTCKMHFVDFFSCFAIGLPVYIAQVSYFAHFSRLKRQISIKYCSGDAKMIIRHRRVSLHRPSAFFCWGWGGYGGDILENFHVKNRYTRGVSCLFAQRIIDVLGLIRLFF